MLYNETAVFLSGVHRFGTDALLLARFCAPHRQQRAVDLCSGCGIVALAWHDAGHRGPCLAVELQPQASALLARAVAENDAPHIRPLCADLRTLAPERPGSWDLVACNPPYFAAGRPSADPARAAARHEQTCTLEETAACAARLLREGGRFALCQRPARLAQTFAALQKQGLEPKRLVFVKKDPTREPWLFLCEAQKGRRPGLRVEPDLLLGAGAAYGPGREENNSSH